MRDGKLSKRGRCGNVGVNAGTMALTNENGGPFGPAVFLLLCNRSVVHADAGQTIPTEVIVEEVAKRRVTRVEVPVLIGTAVGIPE